MEIQQTNTAKPSKIRVGLVDDQQLVRQGIASLLALSDKIEVTWQAENGQQALTLLASTAIDILLSDIRMPVMDGISLLSHIRADNNQLPTLMLTTFDDSELFLTSLHAGANGFLLKDVSLDKLLNAIEVIAQGGVLIEPVVLNQLSQQAPINAPEVNPLSERETSILKFMANGCSNKEIATGVFLAEGTVKNHVSNILSKLGCRDRTRAVLKGLELGII
ncbi:two component transcriptional regulator, LuxR family [Shewanella denitrificans OS217]|uniref:Two component transcriptional regulator, LuxR family n=1 Tax=Shewanella denitrificans (strain OS217 / ATCC BAA-1090 / DSM 15013) TaxID=318161 RepID=Q12JP3_SHEDO|nr:response regulator transcription factor [Shewanella denitrificans]ABE56333.1 two component transcriptional regulator, LuxR family [Shewanella denitrificans OS217]